MVYKRERSNSIMEILHIFGIMVERDVTTSTHLAL